MLQERTETFLYKVKVSYLCLLAIFREIYSLSCMFSVRCIVSSTFYLVGYRSRTMNESV